MTNAHNFLITYGLHNFVSYVLNGGKHAFIIRGKESQKMINHAKSLIVGNYGMTTQIRVA